MQNGPCLVLLQIIQSDRGHDQCLCFHERAPGNGYEVRIVALCRAYMTLRDIYRNGRSTSRDLGYETIAVVGGEFGASLVDQNGQVRRFLPNDQITVRLNSLFLYHLHLVAYSFAFVRGNF